MDVPFSLMMQYWFLAGTWREIDTFWDFTEKAQMMNKNDKLHFICMIKFDRNWNKAKLKKFRLYFFKNDLKIMII